MTEHDRPDPQITLDTTKLSDASVEGYAIPSPVRGDDGLLTVQSLRTPALSDTATLHSRSGSLISIEAARFRSNSTNTIVERPQVVLEPAEDALRPDKGNADDFEVSNNPFAFSPGQLNKLENPKSLSAFHALGGLKGLEKGLRTSLSAGLSADEVHLDGRISFVEAVESSKKLDEVPLDRQDTSTVTTRESNNQFTDRLRVFKDNRLPERKADGIWILIWRTYNDKILILLTVAAVVSLALGLYETFSGGSSVDWVEGVAICVAILIVVIVGALNDYQKERQFIKLNRRKDDREVKAIRSGKSIKISVHDITVGDVLHLEPGDAVPADGIFISGHGIKCDESSATGESDQMRKTGGQEVWDRLQDGTATKNLDPFIISGSKVLEGVGTYLVTSVGVNSSYGKILLGLQTKSENTPLQVKLARLANWIGGLGSAAAGLLFMVLLIRFLVQLSSNNTTAAAKGQEFLDILIVAITVIVVAVPEGLPLAVTLALAFATTRMLKENNLVRVLRACETMGNATTICSDKTGTLTENKMTVVAGTLGVDENFSNGDKAVSTFQTVFADLSDDARYLLLQSIALNGTAFEGEEKGVPTFVGSKTETALLTMAKSFLGLTDLATERANAEIVQLIPFDSARKCMGAVVRMHTGQYRLLVKGAAEIMLSKASQSIASIYDDDFALVPMTSASREQLWNGIDSYAQQSLRTIGLLYRDYPQWPPAGAECLSEDRAMVDFESVFHDLIWMGVVGIHDPLREGVVEAVAQCQRSGVVPRMVTGDNITTARAIATACGIIIDPAHDVVMEGPKFRQLSDDEMDRILPRLRVLARSSPEDKRILVARLKHLGETVAVTGDGTNDGPALKTADVGFSMGIAGTEVAKEASSIILLDDNFRSIITALMWGRAVNDAVKKFLQFQVTVNVTAVVLTFVSAVSNSSNHSVLTAVQLLWVNLIMDTLAALALATDAPTKSILDRPPERKNAPLITMTMWKMITGQSLYQLLVTFVLYFAGHNIFGSKYTQAELDTVVFNTFVWMQIFNQFNCRRLDNKLNIFEGVLRNYWFMGINLLMVAGQIMIVFVGGKAFGITRIDGVLWAVCLGCAAPCLGWAVAVRYFPDTWFTVGFEKVVGAMGVILRPLGKIVAAVFRPLGRMGKGLGRTVKRVTQRGTSRQSNREIEDDVQTHTSLRDAKVSNEGMPGKLLDEESGLAPAPATRGGPATDLGTGTIPPISITGPNGNTGPSPSSAPMW